MSRFSENAWLNLITSIEIAIEFVVSRRTSHRPDFAYFQLYRRVDLLNMTASIWTGANQKETDLNNVIFQWGDVQRSSWRLLPELLLLETSGLRRISISFKVNIFCTKSSGARFNCFIAYIVFYLQPDLIVFLASPDCVPV